jgi:hypothetical protein
MLYLLLGIFSLSSPSLLNMFAIPVLSYEFPRFPVICLGLYVVHDESLIPPAITVGS